MTDVCGVKRRGAGGVTVCAVRIDVVGAPQRGGDGPGLVRPVVDYCRTLRGRPRRRFVGVELPVRHPLAADEKWE